MSINLRHLNTGVSQQLRDRIEINAFHDQVRGKRMPEIVKADLADLHGLVYPFKDIPVVCGIEASPSVLP
jgi:hypothetical protein